MQGNQAKLQGYDTDDQLLSNFQTAFQVPDYTVLKSKAPMGYPDE